MANLSDFDKKRIREIGEQIDIQMALGKRRVPDKDKISSFDWLKLLSCNSNPSLGRKLFYVASKQLSISNELKKKSEQALDRETAVKDPRNRSWDYIRTKTEKQEINAFYDLRLLHEYEFCPSLVFDMSFEDRMNVKALSDLTSQITDIFQTNRTSAEPFQLHFCNLKRDTQQYYVLNRHLRSSDKRPSQAEMSDSFEACWPYTFTDACYTSLFPTRDLIYMSPNAKHEMRYYDPSKVYIIGGLVDIQHNSAGVTKSKAAEQSIRSLRLPRGVAATSLPLNIFFNIIQEVRLSGSWLEARRHMPKRKIIQSNVKSPTTEMYLLRGRQPSNFDKA